MQPGSDFYIRRKTKSLAAALSMVRAGDPKWLSSAGGRGLAPPRG
jgi:hypothetical protein